jgi:hypothetical protein
VRRLAARKINVRRIALYAGQDEEECVHRSWAKDFNQS